MSNPLALVAGSSRGIGKATCVDLAQAGFDIIGFHRGNDDETAAAVESVGKTYYSYQVDVGDEEAVRAGFRSLRADCPGTLRAVVISAGVTHDGLATVMTGEKFRSVFDTNLFGAFYVARESLKAMRKTGGAIVFVSSASGVRGRPGQPNYAASKAGINALVQSLTKEASVYNIRVNAVAPGFTETDMLRNMDAMTRIRMMHAVPLGRPAQPSEIAHVVKFLAMDESSYITGQTVIADGGLIAADMY